MAFWKGHFSSFRVRFSFAAENGNRPLPPIRMRRES